MDYLKKFNELIIVEGTVITKREGKEEEGRQRKIVTELQVYKRNEFGVCK